LLQRLRASEGRRKGTGSHHGTGPRYLRRTRKKKEEGGRTGSRFPALEVNWLSVGEVGDVLRNLLGGGRGGLQERGVEQTRSLQVGESLTRRSGWSVPRKEGRSLRSAAHTKKRETKRERKYHYTRQRKGSHGERFEISPGMGPITGPARTRSTAC